MSDILRRQQAALCVSMLPPFIIAFTLRHALLRLAHLARLPRRR